MPTVIAREGGLVPLPATVDRHRTIDQLLRYSAGAAFPCFKLKRGALCAAEVVGALQIGKLRISILPKSQDGDETRDKEFLLNLLRAAGYLGTSLSQVASVRSTSLDPMESMLIEVGRGMLEGVRTAVPRRYEEVATNSETIRGRIDFQRLYRKIPGTDATLPIRYAPFSSSNALSRTLKWVAECLHRMARSADARLVLGEVLSRFEWVSGPPPTRSEVLSLHLSRYEAVWARTIGVAQLLVDAKFIDPTFAGRTDAFGMLFPLQYLFERSLRRLLSEAVHGLGVVVAQRSASLHMLHDDSNVGSLRLRPDYVLLRNGKPQVIGDAKWKRLSEESRAYGAERADVYQMNAYLSRYEVERAALFVPRVGWMEPGWRRRFTIPAVNHQLHLVSVDIEKLVSRTPAVRAAALSTLRLAVAEVASVVIGTSTTSESALPDSPAMQLA
jgi:5-methylcytosine-specific restriction enzyme subunit McrC